jgi:hypothetical protein
MARSEAAASVACRSSIRVCTCLYILVVKEKIAASFVAPKILCLPVSVSVFVSAGVGRSQVTEGRRDSNIWYSEPEGEAEMDRGAISPMASSSGHPVGAHGGRR